MNTVSYQCKGLLARGAISCLIASTAVTYSESLLLTASICTPIAVSVKNYQSFHIIGPEFIALAVQFDSDNISDFSYNDKEEKLELIELSIIVVLEYRVT